MDRAAAYRKVQKRRDHTSMQHIWQDCSRLLETELTPQQFSAWIKPLKALDFDESTATLTIGAPNRLKLDAIRSQFSDRIAQAASRIAQRPVAIVFAVDGASALAAAMRFPNGDGAGDGAAAEPGPVVESVAGNSEQFERSRLNPNLTFDTFVTGKANQLARAAAMQVAENPGRLVQPAVPVRRRGPRQDPPDPRRGQRHPGAQAQREGALHPRGAVRERRGARVPAQGVRRLQALLPLARPAADRRHPVLRRQGAHAGGVLLRVRGAGGRPQADHHHVRTPTPRN